MANRSRIAAIALSALSLMAGCQDHHWKNYEDIGPLPAPEKPYQGNIVSGKVELGDSVKLRNFKGWSLFIIARPAEGASMLAATKEMVTEFPLSFTITPKHMMLGKVKAGEKITVEAKLDKDGILDTKEEMTVTGKAKDVYELGADNAMIVIDLASQPTQ